MLVFEKGGRMTYFKKETDYRFCRDTLSDSEKQIMMSLLENLSSQNVRLDSKQIADQYAKIAPYSTILEKTGGRTHSTPAQVFGLLLIGYLYYLNQEWQIKDLDKGKIYTKL